MQFDQLKRREFITLLGGAAMAWPPMARAQQPRRKTTVGFLGTSRPATWGPWVAAFVRRLKELGWVEGSTVAIEYRWAEGRAERFAEIAAEFAQLKVDVIVTSGTAVVAAKRAASDIPIVFAIAVDPLGTGLVNSLAHPGGNITGLSLQDPDIAGKRIQLLQEVVPNLHRVGAMVDVGYPAALLEISELKRIAHTLALEVIPIEIREATEIASSIDSYKERVDGLYVTGGSLMASNRAQIANSALVARLATMYNANNFVEAGGLISYGADFGDLFRRAADIVDKILRGIKPRDIPVEQPTKFHLAINLNTAKALGLTIPESFLLQTDQIIE